MEDLIVYEVGLRVGGSYSKFMDSPERKSVEDYADIMKTACPDGEIVFLKKRYQLISTTPYIVNQ